jgi:hypothetical protein
MGLVVHPTIRACCSMKLDPCCRHLCSQPTLQWHPAHGQAVGQRIAEAQVLHCHGAVLAKHLALKLPLPDLVEAWESQCLQLQPSGLAGHSRFEQSGPG